MKDTIYRQQAIEAVMELFKRVPTNAIRAKKAIEKLPYAQPEIIRCKDCKHWRDSDGVYRRGAAAESKCTLNTKEVYDGIFYCGYAERRQDGRSD